MNLAQINEMLSIGTKFAEIMKWDINKIRVVPSDGEIVLYNGTNLINSTLRIIRKSNIKNKILNVSFSYQLEETNLFGFKDWEDKNLFTYRVKPGYKCAHQDTKPSKEKLFHLSLERNIITNYDEICEMHQFMEELDSAYHIKIRLIEEQ